MDFGGLWTWWNFDFSGVWWTLDFVGLQALVDFGALCWTLHFLGLLSLVNFLCTFVAFVRHCTFLDIGLLSLVDFGLCLTMGLDGLLTMVVFSGLRTLVYRGGLCWIFFLILPGCIIVEIPRILSISFIEMFWRWWSASSAAA